MLLDIDQVKTYLLDSANHGNESSEYKITDVTITPELPIDGRAFWKYHYAGQPTPRTRNEYWVADDGTFYSIFGCFKHSLEQIVHGEVTGPYHTNQDDEVTDEAEGGGAT